ncbi:MAG: ABC-F family ATP-binding cassette domain-containing protein [Chloroflexota bacterium]
MLAVDNVSLNLGGRALLNEVTFRIAQGEKAGLVGANGAGKTTLLKIIAGQLSPDGGHVQRPKSVGYLPQEPKAAFAPEQPVLQCLLEARGLLALSQQLEQQAQAMSQLPEGSPELASLLAAYGRAQTEWEHLGGYEAESLARRLLDGLGMGHVDFNQHFANLSGGQKTRLALAALLFRQPELLILDEPTNHLDRSSAGWLMDFIVSLPGTVLLVSHDLVLLDRAIARVLRIDEKTGELEAYRGNYTSYLSQREARRLLAEKQARLAGRQIAQMQATADRWRSGTRATQAKGIERRIERLRDGMPDKVSSSKGPKLQTLSTAPSSRLVLEVADLWKAYDDNIVLSGVGFTLERGQKLALLGPNGAGKTTLLKTIAGRQPADDGVVRLGHNVKAGYYAQEHEALDPAASVLHEARASVAAAGSGTPPSDSQLRSFLGTFLFTGAKVMQSVGTLSGGEKTRLALAKIFLERGNLLLLDEPTNNLDPASQEALLQALKKFDGTLIIVCHAADFMARLAPERALVLPCGESSFFDPALLAAYEPARRGARRPTPQPAPAAGTKAAKPAKAKPRVLARA